MQYDICPSSSLDRFESDKLCFSFTQENLLLDEDQNLKLIDFGLCAKPRVSNAYCLFLMIGDLVILILKSTLCADKTTSTNHMIMTTSGQI